MGSIWVESLGRNFQQALDLMEAAVQDCTDELWQSNMWEVPGQTAEVRDADGELVTDPVERHALVQRNGQPWGVAWHALEVLDANLTGYFGPWEPWPAFGERDRGHNDTVDTLEPGQMATQRRRVQQFGVRIRPSLHTHSLKKPPADREHPRAISSALS